MEIKKQIRQEALQQRSAMPEAEICFRSEEICRRMLKMPLTLEAMKNRGCYAYYPHEQEVSLMPVYQLLLEEGVPLAFPKIKGSKMEFYQVESMEDFSEGNFHINEPVEKCPMVCFEEAVCFVPGIAFDRYGTRYGYGKGYYDKYFAVHKGIRRIGIAYEAQILEQIPAEEYDIPMHEILCETEIIRIEK